MFWTRPWFARMLAEVNLVMKENVELTEVEKDWQQSNKVNNEGLLFIDHKGLKSMTSEKRRTMGVY